MAMAGNTSAGDLLLLQGQIKRDPEGYKDEFFMQYRHYKAQLGIFSLRPTGESKDFADLVMFLSQVAICYPKDLASFPQEIMDLLDQHSLILDHSLRKTLAQALILLRNKQVVGPATLFPLFFRLFRCPDKSLRQLLFSHIVHDIAALNRKHRDERMNRSLQNFLYSMVNDENETAAKKSLAVLIELHKRQVWTDARSVNVIASACQHSKSRIMIAALKFFLGTDERSTDDGSESESSDDEAPEGSLNVQPNKEEIYKAYKKGTGSSKKKKQAKLKRVMQSLKKQQKVKEGGGAVSFAALQLLNDPQGFAEKLFARLRACSERFEVKLMMMNVISRVVGVHRLLLLNFYPYLQRYVQPHQRDVTHLLAALVQACHDQVPPDAVEPVLRQLVNQFVHDRARPEVMAVGLKTVRELCARMPLLMTADLLQDLALYKKSREKAVATAARSLISLFRELAPSLLEKKDRGRGADLEAKPKAYGEQAVPSTVPGVELLAEPESDGSDEEGSDQAESDEDQSDLEKEVTRKRKASENEGAENEEEKNVSKKRRKVQDGVSEGDANGGQEAGLVAGGDEESGDESDGSEELEAEEGDSADEGVELIDDMAKSDGDEAESDEAGSDDGAGSSDEEEEDADVSAEGDPTTSERAELNGTGMAEQPAAEVTASTSLRSLKRKAAELLAAATGDVAGDVTLAGADVSRDGILSDEDFRRIRRLQAKKALEAAMAKHGVRKVKGKDGDVAPSKARGDLSDRRVDPGDLDAAIRKKREKEHRLASIQAGREDRGKFGSAKARGKKKSGGASNKEKQKAKMKRAPLAAQRAKLKSRVNRRKDSKGFKKKLQRGKKAWGS